MQTIERINIRNLSSMYIRRKRMRAEIKNNILKIAVVEYIFLPLVNKTMIPFFFFSFSFFTFIRIIDFRT